MRFRPGRRVEDAWWLVPRGYKSVDLWGSKRRVERGGRPERRSCAGNVSWIRFGWRTPTVLSETHETYPRNARRTQAMTAFAPVVMAPRESNEHAPRSIREPSYQRQGPRPRRRRGSTADR